MNSKMVWRSGGERRRLICGLWKRREWGLEGWEEVAWGADEGRVEEMESRKRWW